MIILFTQFGLQVLNTMILQGFYTSDQVTYPMLGVSNNNYKSVEYKIDKTAGSLPPDFTDNGIFYNSSCNKNFCAAVGTYEDFYKTSYPMLAFSTDSGESWVYEIDKNLQTLPPTFYHSGLLTDVDCGENFCVTSGKYFTKSTQAYPMIAVKNFSETRWRYEVDSRNLPTDYANDANIFSIRCDSNVCLAGGQYGARDKQFYPMLIMSNDSGRTWQYKFDKTHYLFQTQSSIRSFYATKCHKNICIASGDFRNSPQLLITKDGGDTWEYKEVLGLSRELTKEEQIAYGAFYRINCDADTCIAAGEYTNYAKNVRPLLAVSTDGGNTWVYKIGHTLTDNALPEKLSDGVFYDANCKNNTCIAVGNYTQGHFLHPLIVMSTDGAQSWHNQLAPQELPVKYGQYGLFSEANCTENGCYAIGMYEDSNGDPMPLLMSNIPILISDGYKAPQFAWQYQIDAHIGRHPQGFESGQFCTGLYYLCDL